MATFTVTTLLDETFEGSETSGAPDGAGLSLREALALANGNGSAESDTIVRNWRHAVPDDGPAPLLRFRSQ
jgi:hypothetical protein